MSDDLSAFFAKKKDKKKKTAVKMEDVGQILERRAKRQEVEDQQQQVEVDKNDDDVKRSNAGGGGTGAEDSEWIDFAENTHNRLEGLKIKDMGADKDTEDIEEVEEDDEEQKATQEQARTWGQVEKKEETEHTDADMANFQKQATKTSKYVPAALRDQMRNHKTSIDVSNQEMFPSLADAVKIEKDKKDELKTGGGWVKTGSSENRPMVSSGRGWGAPAGPSISNTGKDGAIAALRALHAANPPPTAPVAVSVAPASVAADDAPKKSSYVPPHLRNK